MLLLHIGSLALSALVGTTSATSTRIAHTVAADSGSVIELTADYMTNYMALKKELKAFWKLPAHAALQKSAEASAVHQPVKIQNQSMDIRIYDYPKLVKQDASLAAIFTKHHVAPDQYIPTQVTVFTAIGSLYLAENKWEDPRKDSVVFVKNADVVKPYRKELDTVYNMSVTSTPVAQPFGFGLDGANNDDDQ